MKLGLVTCVKQYHTKKKIAFESYRKNKLITGNLLHQCIGESRRM